MITMMLRGEGRVVLCFAIRGNCLAWINQQALPVYSETVFYFSFVLLLGFWLHCERLARIPTYTYRYFVHVYLP